MHHDDPTSPLNGLIFLTVYCFVDVLSACCPKISLFFLQIPHISHLDVVIDSLIKLIIGLFGVYISQKFINRKKK